MFLNCSFYVCIVAFVYALRCSSIRITVLGFQCFPYPAGVSGRVLYLTRFFLLLLLLLLLLSSSGNTSKTYSFDMPWPISTKLGHKKPLTHGIYVTWPEWGQRSRRGHRGQKGQKLKNATPPTDYRVWSRDSCICISLTTSTKVITLKIHLGSFVVAGVKRSFSLKML